MMRYSKYSSEQGPTEYPPPTNPVWRGIGCILFLITPIIAFLIANEVMNAGLVQQYIYIPPTLRNTFTLPGLEITFTYFYATLLLTAGVTVALFALFFVVYALVYRVIGPSPYGPTDVPPIRSKRKTRKSR
jgi:hypothetical protein